MNLVNEVEVNKVNQLEILKENYRVDLLFVRETWLTASVPIK